MRNDDAGFTLLETIVALAIFVTVVAALQRGLAGGAHNLRLATLETAALQVAKSRLALAGVETPLSEGQSSGATADGIAWTTDIRRYALPGANRNESADPAGYWVTAGVRWSEGPRRPERSLELKTMKLGRASQGAAP